MCWGEIKERYVREYNIAPDTQDGDVKNNQNNPEKFNVGKLIPTDFKANNKSKECSVRLHLSQ